MPDVKRRYDASRRRAEAESVSEIIVETARTLLLTDGYAGTTIPRIAGICGISAEAVYKRFPGKPAVVRAVVEQALRGAGGIPAQTQSDSLPAFDLASLLNGWARLATEVSPRVAPVLLLLRTAATHDDSLAALASDLDVERRSRMTHNARRLAAAGHLRGVMSVAQAADVLWIYSSPEFYELLVIRSGWPVRRYGEFVAAGLAAQFGVPMPARGAREPKPLR